ncbi:Rapid ALkalinization Factor protein [Dioscorea alata]|uniref:Rapid ALkalinization Factor protein n=1 Tax=Dioscorea alata TaxID=55571 RepID=A0ACB7UAX7_DIOAL|nr:Rapid ALkalinization Factor protein [Dioscorea alata]
MLYIISRNQEFRSSSRVNQSIKYSMASGTKPIFVIFIIFSILLLLFTSTPTFAARPISTPTSAAISTPGALNPNRPVCGGARGRPYGACNSPPPLKRKCKSIYGCPPEQTNNVATDRTRLNIKTNN